MSCAFITGVWCHPSFVMRDTASRSTGSWLAAVKSENARTASSGNRANDVRDFILSIGV